MHFLDAWEEEKTIKSAETAAGLRKIAGIQPRRDR